MIDATRRRQQIHALEERRWDALVIGSGPAGSTLARELVARDHAVLLVDKRDFPREKVCGDALIPDALRGLRRAGLHRRVTSEAYRADTLAVFSPANIRVEIPGEFATLRRERLDDLLQQAAVERGAVFHVDDVVAIESTAAGGVRATLGRSGTTVHARVGAIATGADRSLLPRGLPGARGAPSAFALRCYVRSRTMVRELVISFHRAILPGYGWVFPLGGGEYNIGCGVFQRSARGARVNLRMLFRVLTEQFPIGRAVTAGAVSMSPLRGARLRCGLDAECAYDGGRVVSIGETIAATFPFTGEGIGKAMETAELAAEQIDRALQTDDPEVLAAFPSVLRETLAPRYGGYRAAQTWIARPWLTDLLAWRVRHSVRLRHAAAGILSETADPRTVFSWRAMLPGGLRP